MLEYVKPGESPDLGLQFLRAIFDQDGDQAVAGIKDLARKNPRSEIIPALIERIAQHQFASGLYNTSKETFAYIVDAYPSTVYGERGLYFVARCWQAIGRADSSDAILNSFRRKYPRSRYFNLAQTDLNESVPGDESQSADLPIEHSDKPPLYGIQTGAFSTEANAQIQKQFLENKDYQAEIYVKYVDGKRFFVVCVGSFSSESKAEVFGEIIAKKYSTEFQLVDLNKLKLLE